MTETFTAAAVQAAPVAFERERTLEKLRDLPAETARRGARLAVFPEAFVSAYPKSLLFDARVGMRSREGCEDFRRYFDSAVDVPGPAVDFLGHVARENRLTLVVGVIEREIGTLYCTVLFFAPDGRDLGKHRKLMPTADGRKTWIPTMQHVALEGRCFVFSCNQFTRRRDFPADYRAIQGDDPETVVSEGGSCIVSPLGEIVRGKYDFDVVGHYARPDVFRLVVNERPQPPVLTDKDSALP